MTVDIAAANREAVDRLVRARPAWTAVRPAGEALGLTGRRLLHAGPPIAWERMCGPMRGAVTAAVLFEGWARTADDAQALAGSGEIDFAPCHSLGAVGPMAGVISPATPLLVVEDAVNGTATGSFIADGPWGHQLRFGAHGPETLAGLAWIRDVVAPAFSAVLERTGPHRPGQPDGPGPRHGRRDAHAQRRGDGTPRPTARRPAGERGAGRSTARADHAARDA